MEPDAPHRGTSASEKSDGNNSRSAREEKATLRPVQQCSLDETGESFGSGTSGNDLSETNGRFPSCR
jgi:hypothetical protein